MPRADDRLDKPRMCGLDLRYLVLPMLTAQNAGAVLLMRATRSLQGHHEFSTQSAVVMQEICKCLMCIVLIVATEGPITVAWAQPVEALKTGIPALLYLVQNNLQYVAAGTLDAATYTVSYQSKIIWTGVLTVLLLKRHLEWHKWAALVLMSSGVACANLGGSSRTEQRARSDVSAMERFGALVTILAAACCSSLAGVYFEKILKGVKVSLWVRNFQLAAYSILTGVLVVLATPEAREQIVSKGWLHGYTWLTWLCVFWNALGGLLVGTVIKYADAVMKDVSLGASIVLSAIGSIAVLHYQLSAMVAAGIAMVIYSIFLYGGRVNCLGLIPPPAEAAHAKGEPQVTVTVERR